MRLLNTRTLEFGEFYDGRIPPYSILSHRWSGQEVSYQDFLAKRNRDCIGFWKITKACERALTDGRTEGSEFGSWIWIDTCCLNKESSSEVTEAVGSMWRWYNNAEICYVFLDDVPDRPIESLQSFKDRFRRSKWFTRGWTLQELLAPERVEFLNTHWERIGNKAELHEDISAASGIHEYVIMRDRSVPMAAFTAAEKLSWASKRQTSRVEDLAYCLLGLLDLKMSLRYGEGSDAFIRLQEELIRSGDDETVFSWGLYPEMETDIIAHSEEHLLSWSRRIELANFLGVLSAVSPASFAGCANIQRANFHHRPTFSMMSRGLRMGALLIPIPNCEGEFLVPLNCGISIRDSWGSTRHPRFPLALHVSLVKREQNLYRREGCVNLKQPELKHLGLYLDNENRKICFKKFSTMTLRRVFVRRFMTPAAIAAALLPVVIGESVLYQDWEGMFTGVRDVLGPTVVSLALAVVWVMFSPLEDSLEVIIISKDPAERGHSVRNKSYS